MVAIYAHTDVGLLWGINVVYMFNLVQVNLFVVI
jgi:hypothetical protein